MSKGYGTDKILSLSVSNQDDHERISAVCRALSVNDRLRIFQSILNKSKNLSEISHELNMPISSVSRHIDTLVETELVSVSYQPGLKGQTKFCCQTALGVEISLAPPKKAQQKDKEFVFETPVGMYSDFAVTAPCGMVGLSKGIAELDNPDAFFSPLRSQAECIWFDTGFVTYSFPCTFARKNALNLLEFSFEICSETNYFNDVWPSDVTVSVNDTEVALITTPGDFGGRRGRFTPLHWPINSTQFGVLKTVSITNEGIFIDGRKTQSSISLDALNLKKEKSLRLTLQVKKDARFRGGINIFGKNFGDYPQSIVMKMK